MSAVDDRIRSQATRLAAKWLEAEHPDVWAGFIESATALELDRQSVRKAKREALARERPRLDAATDTADPPATTVSDLPSDDVSTSEGVEIVTNGCLKECPNYMEVTEEEQRRWGK